MTKLAQTGIPIRDHFDSLLGRGDRTIGSLVGYFIQGAMVIAGIVFLFLLIGGGIEMISGTILGEKNPLERGRKAVTSALIGFIIIFVSYWAIRLIEEVTGVYFITDPFNIE